MPLFWKITK